MKKNTKPASVTKPPAMSIASTARTYKEQYAAGKALRDACPRTVHAAFNPAAGRPDPVKLVLESEKGRLRDLLPLRHGRMARSPFTFYRGSALAMAYDLSTTPATGASVQCCGDAHLCNFGGFATPERRVIFSINDLDETLPAPWEWDVKRLAVSFVVGCRDNGLSDAVAKDVAQASVRVYRESMAGYSRMKTLDLWYYALTPEELLAELPPDLRKRGLKRIQKEAAKSRGEEIFPKLAETKGEMALIKDQLPTIFHTEDFTPGVINQNLSAALASYRTTLPHSCQMLLDRYHLQDAAIKVVGVGSVGTLCLVLLYMAGDGDPLFLQVKEARPSVLEPFAGASLFPNHGQRVVNGYRLMLPASDMFLGWSEGDNKRHFYIRQLRDIKISMRVETFGAREMGLYAGWCGKALALSHARSGNSIMLSGYMGKSDDFDKAVAAFSMAYADQNEKDHAALDQAVKQGTVKAVFEEERE
jgi:uncharacterized protein (DUF2252 family)